MSTSLIEVGSRESNAKALTKLSIESTKPRTSRFEIPDSKVTGLRLIVQPSGKKSWAVRYTVHGRDKRLTLGGYPTLGLDEARKQAAFAKRSVTLGEDPAAAKKEARRIEETKIAKADSVEGLWIEYRDRHLSTLRKSTEANAKQFFESWVLPKYRKYRIHEMTKRDVLGILDDIVKAGFPSGANRGRAVLTAFFNWLLDRDVIAASPCAGVKPPSANTSRDRVLSDDELRWLWKACEAETYPFGYMIQMLILTGARRNEVSELSESELRLRESLWKLPAGRAKNHREHTVHLTDASLAIIASLPRVENDTGYLFSTNGETSPSGFSRVKRRIDAQMLSFARADATKRGDNPSKVKIPNWVLHDLRRTIASGMARLGVQLPVIEPCLNHVSGSFGGIVGVYQRHSFAEETKIALEKWSAHVIETTGAMPKASNVTVLSPRAVKPSAGSQRRSA